MKKQQNHKIWQTLFDRQLPVVEEHASQHFLAGWESIQSAREHVPSLAELNTKITPVTGWRAALATVRYSDTSTWYQHFARREFVVTDYLRSMEELDFTPEPDQFHDIFGHLPFLMLPEYVELFDLFTEAFFRSETAEQREAVRRLGWFSYEFGLIREQGKLKLFGAGLISSHGESRKVMSGQTTLKPFTLTNVLQKKKAIDDFHDTLFVIESLADLKRQVRAFIDTLPPLVQLPSVSAQVIDKEMDLTAYKS